MRRSFLAGFLPLAFTLSPSRLRLISTIGMGVLVGTALIVIIPEGVETLYSASDYSASAHTGRNVSPRSVEVEAGLLQTLGSREDSIKQADGISQKNHVNALPGPVTSPGSELGSDGPLQMPSVAPTAHHEVHALDKTVSSDEEPEKHRSSRTPHAWIGLSLILGFILMFLLDTLPLLAPPAPARSQNNIYSLSDLSTSPSPPATPPQRSLSTTLGLCIHAAADGIALGASSSSTSTSSLSLIIFVAIMVHKAPAAFGLTAVLLKQGLGKRGARTHLVIFSLAAPVGAIATWLIVRTLGGGGNGEPEAVRWWTGVLLLFSGGTFLLVFQSDFHGWSCTATNIGSQVRSNAHNAGRGFEHGIRREPEQWLPGSRQRSIITAAEGREESHARLGSCRGHATTSTYADWPCALMYGYLGTKLRIYPLHFRDFLLEGKIALND